MQNKSPSGSALKREREGDYIKPHKFFTFPWSEYGESIIAVTLPSNIKNPINERKIILL